VPSSALYKLRSDYANRVKSEGLESPSARAARRAYDARKAIDGAEDVSNRVSELTLLTHDEADELIRIFAEASDNVRSSAEPSAYP
jgi:hypothetical protein